MENEKIVYNILNVINSINNNVRIAKHTSSIERINFRLTTVELQCEEVKRLLQQLKHHPTDIFESPV